MRINISYDFKPEEIPQLFSATLEALALIPRIISQTMSTGEDLEDLMNLAPKASADAKEETPPKPFVNSEQS